MNLQRLQHFAVFTWIVFDLFKASDTQAKKLEQYIAQVDLPDILRKFLRNKLAQVFRQLCATCSASNLCNKMASQ